MNHADDDVDGGRTPSPTDADGETLERDPTDRATLETAAASGSDGPSSRTPTRPAPDFATFRGGEGIGSVIAGKYTLIALIGEGGMGSVYLARQTEPVQREVALKLIKGGIDSKTVLARFEAERQALAMMDHPNIARVFDGGTTPSDQPFFVMEVVRGVPITQYCDEHRLSPNARLELFVQVCNAVQHAHQKGIIHRDLKPANVLVTEVDGRPAPKVIDFGVAKATEQRLTDQSLGDTGAIVGTPTHMSPEQADPSSMDIDTRSDVYALGVMLYELLAGSPPIDARQFRRGAILEMLRMVREVEPPRPSTRLSSAEEMPSIAACRDVEPAQLVSWLRGDIDWIVMKALEKDRDRRYATANGFAADLQRFLADEPVAARPPSRGYRLRKFVRRNRGAVTAAALVAFALLVGIVGTTLGLVEARTQREAAERARGEAVAEAAAKERARLAEAEQRKAAELANQQAFDALKSFTDELMGKLLGSRDKLTETDQSILRNAQRQWEVFARSKGESPEARVIRSEGAAELSIIQYKLGMNEQAEENDRSALALRAGLAADFPEVPLYRLKTGMSHQILGASLRGNGRRAEAEENFRKAVEIFERLAQEFPDVAQYRRRWAVGLAGLANAKRAREDWSGAERHYRDALALQTQLARDSPETPSYRDEEVGTRSNLAFTLKRAGRRAESEVEYRAALDAITKLAAEYPGELRYRLDTANLARDLGVFLYDGGQDEAGAALFPKAIDTLEQLVAEFPSIPSYRSDLARCRRDYGKVLGYLARPVEAAEQFRGAVESQEKLVADHPSALPYLADLGLSYAYFANMLSDGATPADSLEWYGKSVRTLTAAYDRDRQVHLTKSALGKCLEARAATLDQLGKHAEALPEWDQAIELAPPNRLPVARALRAKCRARLGRFAEALAELDEVTKSDPADPIHWYNFASVHAMAAAADAAAAKDESAARAVEKLQEAVKAGYANAAKLANDPDLDPLRTRDDFKKLLADLEKKFPPKPAPAPQPAAKQ
ncbi:MAG: serine/threonine-protein kinase [Isosphaeraceae bacterium]|nr:serine/threonine-protein kinase [Isosphaeraceae bacterium]